MRLKGLNLYGYKSFASRCVFEFADGITAVVGPNGSGKSNVADAIRWVLGEQSFRNLRARTTEDMIFAGSRHRARLGMAEAILTLDNSDHWLPVDYAEVTIGRRAYRSGDNEYLLNNSRVRYRDILDLLGSAGLSRTTYTVIGQGMVDAALALRPEARRELFEEAAGISPQLRKRAETLDRIGETERNLERVADILAELGPRAQGLRRQAERAEEHHLLEQDLNELLRIWYGYRWQQLRAAQAEAESALAEAQQRLQLAQERRSQAAEEQGQASARLAAMDAQLEQLRAQADSLRSEAQRARQRLALATERQRLQQQQLSAIAADQETLHSRQGVLAQEIAKAQQELGALTEQRDVAGQELAGLAERRAELERSVGLLQSAVKMRESQLRTAQAAAARQAARHQEQAASLARLETERVSAGVEVERRAARLQAIEAQIGPLQDGRATLEASIAQAEQGVAHLQQELSATNQELRQAQATSDDLRGVLSQLATRRNTLARQREESAEYAPGVRHVLALADSLGGILGTAARLMQAPQRYEQAIEAALGGRLQNIIAQRWEDAERAIARLKQDRAGWATFLPLDTLRARGALRLRELPGVVGVASELVRFPEELRAVYELLLGRVLVAEDLAAARRLLGERTGASLIVTLSGETVQPTGAVSGGARRNSSQLLAQERAWRELPERLAQAKDRLREAEGVLAAHKERLEEVRVALEQSERERQRLIREHERVNRTLSELEAGHRVAERDRAWQAERAAQASADHERLQGESQASAAELERLLEEEQEHTTALANLRDQLGVAVDEPLRRRLAELETQLAVATRACASQQQLLASHQSALGLNQEQLVAKATQQRDLQQELATEQTRAALDGQELAALETRIAQFANDLAPAQAQRAEHAQQVQHAEDAADRALARVQEAENDVHRAQLDLEHARERQRDLVSEIEAALGPVELPDSMAQQLRLGLAGEAVALPALTVIPAGLEQELRSLRARLRRLGGINPDAPQEYQALMERQTFLEGQMTDLQEAIVTLRQVIQELDAVIEQDFSATVKLVDRAFRDYFRRLFGGGNAHLELTNPEDLSTSGIEIIAHPPGKRAQTLALLSGGERALTAVALVFALLRANPVPFCFLDEVDAALDEANVGRFRDLLLEHAQETQFVVITHNRHTIEAANSIYGISMGEQGVSESVSLKLDDEAITRLAAQS
jgi:chromosome segregation protein